MINAFLGTAEFEDNYETAKTKLGELIDWHVSVAALPSVPVGPPDPTWDDVASHRAVTAALPCAAAAVPSSALIDLANDWDELAAAAYKDGECSRRDVWRDAAYRLRKIAAASTGELKP